MPLCVNAVETSTNWTWVNFGLSIPQTNLFLGDKMWADIIISNTFHELHPIKWIADDPCGYGFGEFLITEISSQKKIKCKYSMSDRGAITLTGNTDLQSHSAKTFNFNLATAYSITNAGIYSVQAIGWFPLNEPATNHQYVTVTTPPLFIKLSSRRETNAPPM